MATPTPSATPQRAAAYLARASRHRESHRGRDPVGDFSPASGTWASHRAWRNTWLLAGPATLTATTTNALTQTSYRSISTASKAELRRSTLRPTAYDLLRPPPPGTVPCRARRELRRAGREEEKGDECGGRGARSLSPEPGEWRRSGRGELVGWLGEKRGVSEGNAENNGALLSPLLGEERERLVTGARRTFWSGPPH